MAIDGRRAWTLGLAWALLVRARLYATSLQVNSNAAAAKMAAVKETAQPLIEALETYRADNGFYPKTLDSLAVK
jgi:hypothetical protein